VYSTLPQINFYFSGIAFAGGSAAWAGEGKDSPRFVSNAWDNPVTIDTWATHS